MTVNTIAAVASASSLAAVALFAVWLVYYRRQRSAERQVRRQLRRLSRRVAQLEGRLEPHSIVPPMHIFLERTQRQWHAADELCHRIDGWLQQHGFQRIGYFQIEELGGEELSAYLRPTTCWWGAVRMPTGAAEPYVEFCFDLGQGRAVASAIRPVRQLACPLTRSAGIFRVDCRGILACWIACTLPPVSCCGRSPPCPPNRSESPNSSRKRTPLKWPAESAPVASANRRFATP